MVRRDDHRGGGPVLDPAKGVLRGCPMEGENMGKPENRK